MVVLFIRMIHASCHSRQTQGFPITNIEVSLMPHWVTIPTAHHAILTSGTRDHEADQQATIVTDSLRMRTSLGTGKSRSTLKDFATQAHTLLLQWRLKQDWESRTIYLTKLLVYFVSSNDERQEHTGHPRPASEVLGGERKSWNTRVRHFKRQKFLTT